MFDREEVRLLKSILRVLEDIDRNLNHHYVVHVTQENSMAIGNIQAGTSGSFLAVLDDNGSAIALPSDSTFVWTASDASVTITPSSDSTTAVVAVPAGDAGTSITVTATVTVNGTAYAGSVTVALTPIPQVFTVVVTQTA